MITLSSELNIDEVFSMYNEKSPSVKGYKTEWKRFLREEEGLEKNRKQKVDYRGEVFRESSTDSQIRRRYDEVEKGGFGVYYDSLYYEGVYEFEDSGYYSDRGEGLKENRIGLRKPINDIFYSEKKYEENYINIKRGIIKADLIHRYLEDSERITDSYKEILMLQHSINMDSRDMEDYKKLYEIALRKTEVGEGLPLEADYIKAEGMEVEERIKYNRSLKDIKLLRLAKEVGMEIERGSSLVYLPEIEGVDVVGNNYDIQRAYEEINLESEEIKLEKRREQTEVTLGGDYDTERELWSLRFNIEGSLFDYPLGSALVESDVEIMNQKVDYLEDMRITEVLELEKEYEHLKSLLEIKRLKKENRDRTVEIAREMYSMGYITAKKLIEEKKSAREAEMEYSEVLHRLGAFEYKMYLRKNVELVWSGIIN